MFRFVTSRPLWVNVLAGIVLIFLFVIIFMLSLNWCTAHGKTLLIPAVIGMPYDKARQLLESKGFEVQIQDSMFLDTIPPLTVLKQFPKAESLVKKNRTVYLTVNRVVAPTIDMPQLVNLTFRNADVTLKQYGLRLGDTTYKVDFAKNSVLDQVYNGQSIKPGTKLQMGATIDLVLGTGVSAMVVQVPDLFGLTYEEAKTLLQINGLTVGTVIPITGDVRDTASAYIVRQAPVVTRDDGKPNFMRGGQSIDVWVQVDKPLRPDSTRVPMPSGQQ
jgi:beta-lactam-binding protein with PASTA domain